MKSRPEDEKVRDSLHVVLSAMHEMKKSNSLTDSFLVQLDVHLGGSGLKEMRNSLEETSTSGEATERGCFTKQ